MKQPLVSPSNEKVDPELQKLITFYNETLGFCPNSVKTMYHRPRIAHAFIEMNKAVMENKGKVSSSLKRLIGYISSLAAGCSYCQAHTIRAAERYGADSNQLNNIWEYKTHPAFSESERAALELALRSSTIPNSIDDVTAKNIRKHFSEGEIVEIMGVISLFGFLNRWNDSMGTEIEDAALSSGKTHLEKRGWKSDKHTY